MISGFDSGEVAERSRVEQEVRIQLALTIGQVLPYIDAPMSFSDWKLGR